MAARASASLRIATSLAWAAAAPRLRSSNTVTVRSAPQVGGAATAPPSILCARARRRRGAPRLPHPRGLDRASPSRRPSRRRASVLAVRTASCCSSPRTTRPRRDSWTPLRRHCASSGLGASGGASVSLSLPGTTRAPPPCRACQGTGALSPGGFHAKIAVDARGGGHQLDRARAHGGLASLRGHGGAPRGQESEGSFERERGAPRRATEPSASGCRSRS